MGEKAIEFYKRAIKSLGKLRHGSAKLFTKQIMELWQILAERQDERELGQENSRSLLLEQELESTREQLYKYKKSYEAAEERLAEIKELVEAWVLFADGRYPEICDGGKDGARCDACQAIVDKDLDALEQAFRADPEAEEGK
jgi:hypothetical protein